MAETTITATIIMMKWLWIDISQRTAQAGEGNVKINLKNKIQSSVNKERRRGASGATSR